MENNKDNFQAIIMQLREINLNTMY